MTKFSTVLVAILVIAGPAYAKDKNSSMEDKIGDAFSNDDHQGQGKPDNPGQHGRENAAQKQRENPGKGSKGGDSWDDLTDKDKDQKQKQKQKNKNKNKNK